MSTLYNLLASEVSEILLELGQRGSIQRPTAPATGGGPTDPTGGTPGTAPDPVAASLALFPITDKSRIDGTNILETDVQVVSEAIEGGISPSDKVVCAQGTFSIIDLGEIAPDGTVVAYDMICRGPA